MSWHISVCYISPCSYAWVRIPTSWTSRNLLSRNFKKYFVVYHIQYTMCTASYTFSIIKKSFAVPEKKQKKQTFKDILRHSLNPLASLFFWPCTIYIFQLLKLYIRVYSNTSINQSYINIFNLLYIQFKPSFEFYKPFECWGIIKKIHCNEKN